MKTGGRHGPSIKYKKGLVRAKWEIKRATEAVGCWVLGVPARAGVYKNTDTHYTKTRPALHWISPVPSAIASHCSAPPHKRRKPQAATRTRPHPRPRPRPCARTRKSHSHQSITSHISQLSSTADTWLHPRQHLYAAVVKVLAYLHDRLQGDSLALLSDTPESIPDNGCSNVCHQSLP